MKKFLVLFAALLTLGFSAKADHDQVINFNQLPATAQKMLKQNFSNKVPLIVTMDWDDYTIVYDSGEKVEFDKEGNWKEIECRSSRVPTDLIPEQIKTHIKNTFPGTTILKIDRNRRGYEVKLNNGLEVEYNRSFQVIDIDD
ncbi:MAG: PepSY-like domain-containing protein [Muribaculaceae bacterium]|nr:PepSY-like domain-containing protein [Muribaculaceae bacterium]